MTVLLLVYLKYIVYYKAQGAMTLLSTDCYIPIYHVKYTKHKIQTTNQ